MDEILKTDEKLGQVRVADEVVSVIAGMAATEIEGIAGMSGGIVGGIVSTLFGVVGGPLVGAAVGAAGNIISNSDSLEISLIKNPINCLNLYRQCIQWIWECSEYEYNPIRVNYEK